MAMKLLTTNTSSGAASSSFTSSIDSTYKLYVFKFYDVNPATNSVHFQFNASTDGGSNYNATKTTTFFRAAHNEGDSVAELTYEASQDLAQSTAAQMLCYEIGNGSDESGAGELFLFNPSNTTYVKHFYSTSQTYQAGDYSMNAFIGGYLNTTSAVNAIQFAMSSGNMDGTIKMYGVG